MNSVVTTRNLLDAARRHGCLRRFVNVSSFAVYDGTSRRRRRLLDESCPLEPHPELRGDAYCFAKVKQDELVGEYGARFGIPYVIVRPGYVYGPGNEAITGRVGIGTFGIFLHLGGSNTLPLTYVDNCAEAIVLAGVTAGIDGEVFNVVDDDLPSSRQFLGLYKRNVRHFRSIYLPHAVSYALGGSVGARLELVGRTVAARLQPQQLARLLGQDAIQQREVENPARLDAADLHRRGAAAVLSELPGEASPCLESPSSAAGRSRTPTPRRSGGSRDARSSRPAIGSR